MQEDREAHGRSYEKALQSGIDTLDSHVCAVRDQLVKARREAIEAASKPPPKITPTVKDKEGELKRMREEKESLQSELAAVQEELKITRRGSGKGRFQKTPELQKMMPGVVVDPKNVAEMLMPLLKHADPIVRKESVEAAVDLGSPRLLFPLIQCLDDPNPGVRHAALAAIRVITKENVVDRLPEDRYARRVLVRKLRRRWINGDNLSGV